MARDFANVSRFAHRLNDNASVDSICLRCFRTVASKNFESDLGVVEAKHVCEPRDIIRLNCLTKMNGTLIEFVARF
jgi:hypothetical protein